MASIFDSSDLAYKPIENYGVIGNLSTVALVGLDGSIDFMCFPEFDSPTIFAALLDHKKGGCFRISPAIKTMRQRQLYYPNTNVLLTRFMHDDGVGEVTDFMPVMKKNKGAALIRQVTAVRGSIQFHMVCAPRFNYGQSSHQLEEQSDQYVFSSNGPDKQAFVLRSEVPCTIKEGDVHAEFTLSAGQSISFVFQAISPANGEDAYHCANSKHAFHETTKFWTDWLSKSTYRGRWREVVDRSALTLKLLTSAKHGSTVASPTFGLPEEIGGKRNWDYRYTWIRDASFTLYALMGLGFTEEASAFMKWIEARCSECEPDGTIHIMYGIDGRHDLPESVLKNFEGYRRSAPVRIGNAAAGQLQLDIYGELMDSVYIYDAFGEPISHQLWSNMIPMADWVCNNWRQPDEGIWEVRGGKKEFLYSRVMCWVALDRALRIAANRSFPGPIAKWQSVRDEIFNDVYANFWNPNIRAFTQYKGSSVMDASALIMPLVKFTSAKDPQWLETLNAIQKELVSDSLVYRYREDDGLEGSEGTFCMVSFWYVENLARAGKLEEARFIFEKMLSYANHVGLYSEELGARGEHLGNMPQAFTHLALISAALHLDRALNARGGA